MGYQQEKKRQEQFSGAVETATNAANEIKLFMSRHPEIRDVLANYQICYSYFNNALDEIDLDSLEDCWANHPKFKSSLALWDSQADERGVLEDRIIELYSGGTSKENLKQIRTGFRFSSIEALRAKKDELEEKAALRQKSTAELRQILQKPEPEKELPREISAAQIRMWSPENFRYWAQKLGSLEPVTRRLNEKR